MRTLYEDSLQKGQEGGHPGDYLLISIQMDESRRTGRVSMDSPQVNHA